MQRFPAAVASRAFEAIVFSAPGFSQDENGRYHFQGGHSQQLLVIDGQPIGVSVWLYSSPLPESLLRQQRWNANASPILSRNDVKLSPAQQHGQGGD